jgi:NAD(P) transhydrogenase subunit alpha
MDALSSQSTIAGYKAALMGADALGRFLPMLTTAAGTVRPARVLVFGAGVAGLQALATAHRLGAIIEAYDVRKAAKEQVESVGGRFLELEIDAEAEGGYARELTDEEKEMEKEMLEKHVNDADIVITTAMIPGRPAPQLISSDMVKGMKKGSVIIDLAAETGGNCELTKKDEEVNADGVLIYGPSNIPAMLPVHASEMYSRNLFNLVSLLTTNGESLELDWEDEIIQGSCLTHAGEIKNETTRNIVEGEK